jgi:release factor glutamine methyltransferase
VTVARSLVDAATSTLSAGGVPTARVDAEQLLAACLGQPRTRLALIATVDADTAAHFTELVARRTAREPLQHLIGTAAFRHVEVAVGPGVFVPRPETELLVDAVLPVLRAASRPVVVDLCSGSGALALAVADEQPSASVYAVERSPDALDWLRRNCAGSDIEVVAGDVADPGLLPLLTGRVDAVLANPPYVAVDEEVAPEVRFDRPEALFAGPDGLAVMPPVIAAARRLLRPGGVLAVEHGDAQGSAVVGLLSAGAAWLRIADHRDLADRSRYATAERASAGPADDLGSDGG